MTAPVYGVDYKNIAVTLANADSTTYKDAYDNSAGSKAVRVEGLSLTSTDTSTVNIQFAVLKGGTAYLLGTCRAVTLSGTDGAAAKVAALSAGNVGTIAPDGIYDVWIEAGAKLQVKTLVAVTADKLVTVTGRVRTFE